jgi:hypothetical protein
VPSSFQFIGGVFRDLFYTQVFDSQHLLGGLSQAGILSSFVLEAGESLFCSVSKDPVGVVGRSILIEDS